MTLTYEFEDVVVNIPNGYGEYPHTHEETTNVIHEYEVDITVKDLVAYLTNFKANTKVSDIAESLDELESKQEFYDFMKDRYEQKAWENFQKYNDNY